MDIDEKFNDLISLERNKSLQSFLDRLDVLITDEIGLDRIGEESDLFDKDFLDEVKNFCETKATLHFGKTLRDLKCVIADDNFREHVIWLQNLGPKKLRIIDMNLPRSPIQEQVFRSLDEVVTNFKKHLAELSNYLDELRRIDLCCTVIEPVRPTFKEDYRKIQLADKIWLHVDVDPDGSAKNLRLLGQVTERELEELLHTWDHDKDIATNISKIISSLDYRMHSDINQTVAVPECGICFCVEIQGDPRVPLPLCTNTKCGAYFHKSCLYEWLVACKGGRTPQFGVGKCPIPNCSQYIQCSDRDIR